LHRFKYCYIAGVKEDEMVRACSTNGEKRNAYRILVGMAEGKRPLGRPRHRWVGNIKIDLKRKRMGWYGLDRWLRIGPVKGSCEHDETSDSLKCWEVLE
jgi:hypothetical protein